MISQIGTFAVAIMRDDDKPLPCEQEWDSYHLDAQRHVQRIVLYHVVHDGG